MQEFAGSDPGAPQDALRPPTDAPDLLVRGLARSMPWVCLLVVLGGVAGLGIGLLRPDRFASTTKLMLRPGAREQLTSESLVGIEGEHLAAPPSLNDEMHMLADPAILEQVAKRLGPGEVLDPANDESTGPPVFAPLRWLRGMRQGVVRWIASQREAGIADEEGRLRLAARVLKEDTTIENELGSNVIVVTHTSTSPEKARKVAQTIAEAFIDRHRAQFSIQSLVEASRVKLEHARELRDSAASAYLQDVGKSGFADLDPQVPALTAELAALEKEFFDGKVRKQALGKQRARLSGKLDDVPAEIVVNGPVVMVPNEEYSTWLSIKREAVAGKQALATGEKLSIAETNRRLAYLNAQIAEADQKLKALPTQIAQNQELRENAQHSVLSTRVEDIDLEEQELSVKLEALEQRVGDKRAHLAELRGKILAETLRQKDLEARREVEETSYKQALQRFTMLDALGKIEKQEQPNLRVLQAATLETEKVGPKRLSLILKGLCAGFLVGAAFAVLRQRLDKRLQRPEAVERIHGMPVLGVVPDVAALHPSWARTLTGWSWRS